MEFLGKYELRERITSGPIEVFLAQELRSRLSRLVHILEWKEHPEGPTSQEILKLIRRWAPDPPGIILEAAIDPQTSYAYLITTLPTDPLAVQEWVQSYERLAKGVRGNSFAKALHALKSESAVPPEPAAAAEAGRAEKTPLQSGLGGSELATAPLNIPIPALSPSAPSGEKTSAEPGEFTRMFGGMGAPQPKASSGQFPVAEVAHSNRPAPGEPSLPVGGGFDSDAGIRNESGAFTKEFLGILGGKPPEREPLSTKSSPGGHESPQPGTFTREFFGLAEKPPAAPSPTNAKGSVPPATTPAVPSERSNIERRNIMSDIDIPPARPEYSPLGRSEFFGKDGYEKPNAGTLAGPHKGSQTVPPASEGPGERGRTGEFTEFFRGGGGHGSGEPNQRVPLVENSQPSGFGSSFRGEDRRPGKDLFGEQFSPGPSQPAPGTFAGNSKASEPFPAPNLSRNERQPVPRLDSGGEFGGVGKSQNYSAPQNAAFDINHPNFKAANFESANLEPANLGPGSSTSAPSPEWDRPAEPAGATRVFSPPGAGPTPNSAPLEDGPSEFTIIQQGKPPQPLAPAAAKQGPGSGPVPFKPPSMQAPPMPPTPMMPHPQVPHSPAGIPPMTPPMMPGAKVPAKPAAPATKTVSYLPLIIGLNVVLLLAIALILYFALKAH